MKKALIAITLSAAVVVPAMARDTPYMIALADVLAMPEANGKLDGSVKFFMKGQATPKVQQRFSEDVSNRKTNGVNKEDVEGCKWAALSALMAFQEKAKASGANAVIDIVSYYKKHEINNSTSFECHAGAVVIGVALKGTYAKVDN